MNSITFARFAGERTLAVAGYLWQWDYGQVLKIEGLDLPTEYEVHFSNTSETGTTVTVLGDKNGVNIPDALLETGNPIFAFIYLHDLETDGETEYKIKIPVRKRPHPDRPEPSPEQTDLITQAITALNAAVERTDASAEEAGEAAELAQQAAGSVAGYAQRAAESAQEARDAADGMDAIAQTAIGAKDQAVSAAQTATAAKTAAQEAAASVEEHVSDAEEYARQAAQSASDASQSASAASQSAQSAAGSATSAGTSAQTATAKAQEASDSASGALASAGAASDSATQAGTKANEAAQSASAASGSASSAAQSASDASDEADRAETAASNVSSAVAQIATNTADISDLKADLNEINPIFSDYFKTEQHTNVTTNNMAWTEGKYFDLNTGEEKSLNSYSHTDKFSCDASDIIGIGLNTGQVLFWGASGYLSYVATSPSTAMQITAPTGATEYACNNRNVNYRPDTTTISKTTETKSLITKAYDAPAQALLVDFENKKYASTANGNLYSGDSYASYYCAYRFPCKPSHKYRTSTHTQVVFYNDSKAFISAYVPTINGNNATGVKVEMDFTTPANCAYISINSNFATETVFDLEYVVYGNEKSAYNLIGKTVVCFGDSITGNYNFGDNYPYQIEEKTGAKVYNVGFGGCRMELTNETSIAYVNPFSMVSLADAIVSNASDRWDTQDANAGSFAQKSWVRARLEILKSIDFSDVDIVTIAYGTNGIGLPIENESNPLDTYSYAGATRYAIKTLLEKYPHLRIVLLTPIYRWYSATSDDGDTHQISGQTLLDRVTKLLSVGAEIKIPTIDLYHTLGINKYNYIGYFGDNDETADGTHINTFGREQMGFRIAGELNRLF